MFATYCTKFVQNFVLQVTNTQGLGTRLMRSTATLMLDAETNVCSIMSMACSLESFVFQRLNNALKHQHESRFIQSAHNPEFSKFHFRK